MFKRKEVIINEKIFGLLSDMECCSASEQKPKIKEINDSFYKMDRNEFDFIFSTEMCNEINKMIEEKKMNLENALLLLKHIGYIKELHKFQSGSFKFSLLPERIEKMICEEFQKKDGMNKKILVDLSECYLLLIEDFITNDLIVICVPYLLKVALKNEENEEAQKELEIALLALSNIGQFTKIPNERYFNEIKEIMQYHQEHLNLTRFAIQFAWEFLINRLFFDGSEEEAIASELNFVEGARRELEVLSKCVYLKKKKEERGKETKVEILLMIWLKTLEIYFRYCRLRNEEFVGFIDSLVKVLRAARENKREISYRCIYTLREAAKNESVRIDDLLREGAVEAVLEEFHQATLNDKNAFESLRFFDSVSRRLKKYADDEMEEEERKELKRKIFEKMEEVGPEDNIMSCYERLNFLNRKYLNIYRLPLNISDYFVNA
ncbi:uncharacterized protein MONOS_17634 [Monocercomonoides exilis]|uniref:uncharacterized protein n=1 Tax=Monocercomonoides exilis TaxID=2049356 RepID=UPI00355AA7FD|nr:hypothetical protein MONOS_17634 [Monocercomonoides exilis]